MLIPLGGDNAFFVNLYTKYLRDPESVPADWIAYFEELRADHSRPALANGGDGRQVNEYLQSARRLGHRAANLDPLGLSSRDCGELDGLRELALAGGAGLSTIDLGGRSHSGTPRQLVDLIDGAYRGSIGLEADHLDDRHQAEWLYQEFERAVIPQPDDDLVASALRSILLADRFESFMRVKFPSKKRFGSEGSESSLAFLREVFAAASGADEIVMGGMHRGRLAVLAVALGKSPATLAAELMGRDLSEGAVFTGDVPYHLGYRTDFDFDGRRLGLTLLPHPSHLMVVAPVALGMARATAAGGSRTICLLMHTDAAFSGQGVTAELMQIGGLRSYTAGGTIHLVVNNQIGFTTLPSEGRSSRYCTDIAKMVGVPVLHVNGDDPIAVARTARLALEWRTRFCRDIVVDMVCYRRFGHNELDEPRFTQPGIWSAVDQHPSLREAMMNRLESTHQALIDAVTQEADIFSETLQQGFQQSSDLSPNYQPIQPEAWNRIETANEEILVEPVLTGRPIAELKLIGAASSIIGAEIKANPKVRRFYEQRSSALEDGNGINFATAEALAFATLMDEGYSVRISGQDVVRGTFTQRHMAVHDMTSGVIELPVSAARVPTAPRFEAVNSPLSEYGVLSFEYGYSLSDPDALTIWEAQFGDFLNGAQSIVDQYIVSAEAKWYLRSGLVLQLPHGLEGQGPDHSSARIERLLQMCAGANILVANPSTPANLFHLLRRQLHARWRKPLFLIAPKSLLRARAAVSALTEMDSGTSFLPVIAEDRAGFAKPKRVVLCSGKIAYALEAERAEAGLNEEVAVVRVEQLYPLAVGALKAALAPLGDAPVVWLQEEAENQGPWPHLMLEFSRLGIRLDPKRPVYSRPAMSVTAGGSVERHEREQAALLAEVLSF